jgi:hypothetical protein
LDRLLEGIREGRKGAISACLFSWRKGVNPEGFGDEKLKPYLMKSPIRQRIRLSWEFSGATEVVLA